MHIHLRKCYPYYGKYKIRISFSIPGKTDYQKIQWMKLIHEFLKENIGDENYKRIGHSCNSYWTVYIKDFEHLEIIEKVYKKQIWLIHKPAPGYEHLEGRAPKQERILYYNRFPYRIVFNLPHDNTIYELVEWCEENSQSEFKKSGYFGNVSFYFMRPGDAAMMKLIWGDHVVDTHMPDASKIEPLLRDNIAKAEADLEDFLEGIKDLES